MALYDLERGGAEIEAHSFYKKYIHNTAKSLAPASFDLMVSIIDEAINNLQPSEKSKLLWTRCAALCGYQAETPDDSKNHIWGEAIVACRFDPEGPNKFVGSLIMWRISLREDTWLTSKTKDTGGVHDYRGYWINNNFVPYRKATLQDLAGKFNRI
jgi:hypothetical protein